MIGAKHVSDPEYKKVAPCRVWLICLYFGSDFFQALQVARGMEYIEGLGLAHRDLAVRSELSHSRYTTSSVPSFRTSFPTAFPTSFLASRWLLPWPLR